MFQIVHCHEDFKENNVTAQTKTKHILSLVVYVIALFNNSETEIFSLIQLI